MWNPEGDSSQVTDIDALKRSGTREERRRILGDVVRRHRDRLGRMVHLRLDARLRGRVDTACVIRDTYLDALRELDDYLDRMQRQVTG